MKRSERQFALCVKNKGYAAALERGKVYEVLADKTGAELRQIRVVDESCEDYLYPEEYFVTVRIPESAEKAVLRAVSPER